MKEEEPHNVEISYRKLVVLFISGNAYFGLMFLGYVFSVFNPMQKFIKDHVYTDMSEHVLNLMSSFTPLGGAIGAIIASSINSRYGRRKVLIFTDITSIAAIVLTLLPNQYLLLAGRLISGICGGLNAGTVPLYSVEMSPTEMRGITGSFNMLFSSTAILVSFFLGLGIPEGNDNPDSWWWRFMLGIPIILPLTRLIVLTIFFPYETPKFLMLAKNETKAKETLSHIYSKESRVLHELDVLKDDILHSQVIERTTYKDLFSPYFRKRFFVGCFLEVFAQISGESSVLLYSTEIFRGIFSTNIDTKPQTYTAIVGIIRLIAACITTSIVSRVGRKTMLIAGGIVEVISLLVFVIIGFVNGGQNQASAIFLYIFVLAYGTSFGSVTYIYLPEILPDVALGIASCLNWVMSFMVAQAFPYMAKALGYTGSFMIFDITCLLSLLFVIRFIRETRNKNSFEIGQMYHPNAKAKAEATKDEDNSEEQSRLLK